MPYFIEGFQPLSNLDSDVQCFSGGPTQFYVTFHLQCEDPNVKEISGVLNISQHDFRFKSQKANPDGSMNFNWKKKDAINGIVSFKFQITAAPLKYALYNIGANYKSLIKTDNSSHVNINPLMIERSIKNDLNK